MTEGDTRESGMIRRREVTGRSTAAFGTFVALLLLVACAAGDAGRSGADYDPGRAGRMFAAGYQDIAAVYIDEVSPRQLAEAGLRQLHSLDDRLELAPREDRFELLLEHQPTATYALPGYYDFDGWGALTAAVVSDARSLSEPLASAESEALYGAVFTGMIGELDGYSRYAGREEAQENRASRSGFGGIGVRIRMADDGVLVLSVMEDTPAEQAGLRDEDLILAIDGTVAKELDQREVVRRLRGPVDSRVRLLVRREGVPAPLEIAVRRSHIVPQTVHFRMEGDVAVFRLTGFNHATTATLRQKLTAVEQEFGDRIAGYVLDLRSNPGGLLDQSVTVADLFVEQGRIVSTHGRHPDSHQYFESRRDALVQQRPMVVLINGNSASASEIVAAALQDAARAVVIGSNSFGKGTVQTVLRLPNEGELTLTWARFHAPSGYSLHRRGIMPDICTSGEVGDADDVLAEVGRGRNLVHRELRQRQIDDGDDAAVAAFRARCPTRDGESEVDLRVALQLLHNPGLYATAQRGATITAEAPPAAAVQ